MQKQVQNQTDTFIWRGISCTIHHLPHCQFFFDMHDLIRQLSMDFVRKIMSHTSTAFIYPRGCDFEEQIPFVRTLSSSDFESIIINTPLVWKEIMGPDTGYRWHSIQIFGGQSVCSIYAFLLTKKKGKEKEKKKEKKTIAVGLLKLSFSWEIYEQVHCYYKLLLAPP